MWRTTCYSCIYNVYVKLISFFFTFEIIAAPTTLISFFMFEFLESAKSEVVKWCLNNSFEFIEMNSEEEETEEEEGNVNVSFP